MFVIFHLCHIFLLVCIIGFHIYLLVLLHIPYSASCHRIASTSIVPTWWPVVILIRDTARHCMPAVQTQVLPMSHSFHGNAWININQALTLPHTQRGSRSLGSQNRPSVERTQLQHSKTVNKVHDTDTDTWQSQLQKHTPIKWNSRSSSPQRF